MDIKPRNFREKYEQALADGDVSELGTYEEWLERDTFFTESVQRDILLTGLYGHIYSADVHVSSMVPNSNVYILGPDEAGKLKIPVQQDSSADFDESLAWALIEEHEEISKHIILPPARYKWTTNGLSENTDQDLELVKLASCASTTSGLTPLGVAMRHFLLAA